MPILSYKEHGFLFLSSQIQKRTFDSFRRLFRRRIRLSNPLVPHTRLSNQDAPKYAVKETQTLLAFIYLKEKKDINYKSNKSKVRISYTTNGHLNLKPIDRICPLRARTLSKQTWENAHVKSNFKHGFKCQTTGIFGIMKDGSLIINDLSIIN